MSHCPTRYPRHLEKLRRTYPVEPYGTVPFVHLRRGPQHHKTCPKSVTNTLQRLDEKVVSDDVEQSTHGRERDAE